MSLLDRLYSLHHAFDAPFSRSLRINGCWCKRELAKLKERVRTQLKKVIARFLQLYYTLPPTS